MSEVEVGKVVDYFTHVDVVAIEVTGDELCVGDTIHILGHTTDLEFKVNSIQKEHHQVERAQRGETVGIKCEDRTRPHDKVFKVQEVPLTDVEM